MNNKFTFEKSKESNIMKTIRFPEELYCEIDNIVKQANKEKSKKEYSFNGFVVSACKFALNNMEK